MWSRFENNLQETRAIAVKSVVAEEETSGNLVIFGLTEDPTEQITENPCEEISILTVGHVL